VLVLSTTFTSFLFAMEAMTGSHDTMMKDDAMMKHDTMMMSEQNMTVTQVAKNIDITGLKIEKLLQKKQVSKTTVEQ